MTNTADMTPEQIVARYHYLGYTPMSGSQIRYRVHAEERLVALLSFGVSAWKLAERDRLIGWNDEQRQRNLQLIVNNARFLILTWIQSKGLASKILAMAAPRLPSDWLERYGYRPVMLETFVESPRHKGICYPAPQPLGRSTCLAGQRAHRMFTPISRLIDQRAAINLRSVEPRHGHRLAAGRRLSISSIGRGRLNR